MAKYTRVAGADTMLEMMLLYGAFINHSWAPYGE